MSQDVVKPAKNPLSQVCRVIEIWFAIHMLQFFLLVVLLIRVFSKEMSPAPSLFWIIKYSLYVYLDILYMYVYQIEYQRLEIY